MNRIRVAAVLAGPILAGTFITAGIAHAATSPISNPSFEIQDDILTIPQIGYGLFQLFPDQSNDTATVDATAIAGGVDVSEGIVTVAEGQGPEQVTEPMVSVGDITDGEQITVEFVVIQTGGGAPEVTTQTFDLTCHFNTKTCS